MTVPNNFTPNQSQFVLPFLINLTKFSAEGNKSEWDSANYLFSMNKVLHVGWIILKMLNAKGNRHFFACILDVFPH